MIQEATDLLKRALALPVSERADLAGSLIESLDDTQDHSVAAAWDEEVARRMADIDSGAVQPVHSKTPVVACCPLSNERFLILFSSGRHRRSGFGYALVP
jgi:putative addiction module component (TIGR02574 family)